MRKRVKDRGHSNWRQEAEALSRDEMARLRWKVLCRFGILPTSREARALRDRDVLACALHMFLDTEEQRAQLCPACRAAVSDRLHFRCGEPVWEENSSFDPLRFEELKNRG